MKIAQYKRPILISVFILGFIWLVGCTTTGQSRKYETQVEDVADIDELLGLGSAKESESQEDEDIAEDDVLRLLGVLEEGEPATAQTQSTTDVRKSNLENQIQQYEQERQELDKREKTLRDQVAYQDDALASAGNQPDAGIPSARSETAPSLQGASFTERYQDALRSYRAKSYRDAIQKFEALLTTNSRHSLSDNCQYWIGESYYGLGSYQQAIAAFQNVFSFANSNKDDASQLKLGLCYMRLQDTQRAKIEFEKLISNYPTSEFVNIARRFVAQIE
jgi:tol-pal system protein YbgF